MFSKLESYLQLNGDRESLKNVENKLVKNMNFNFTYLLILLCAVLTSNFGILTNAIMVIVGAKLISPILAPTLATSYAIVFNKKSILKTALLTLLKTLFFGILISTLFFLLFNDTKVTAIIINYSSPSYISVLIALTAGVIASIAYNKKDKLNILPGVAVAVSLVPPLSVIGYGLSILDFKIAVGSLLIFIIYTSFISLSSVIIFYLMEYKNNRNTMFKNNLFKVIYPLFYIILLVFVTYYNLI